MTTEPFPCARIYVTCVLRVSDALTRRFWPWHDQDMSMFPVHFLWHAVLYSIFCDGVPDVRGRSRLWQDTGQMFQLLHYLNPLPYMWPWADLTVYHFSGKHVKTNKQKNPHIFMVIHWIRSTQFLPKHRWLDSWWLGETNHMWTSLFFNFMSGLIVSTPHCNLSPLLIFLCLQ